MSHILEILPSLLWSSNYLRCFWLLVLVFSDSLDYAGFDANSFEALQWLLNIFTFDHHARDKSLLLQLIHLQPLPLSVFGWIDAAIIAFILNYVWAYFLRRFSWRRYFFHSTGQYEAAKVLKFTPVQTIRLIIAA